MRIRRFQAGDESSILNLFRQTILTVNRRDYSEEQVQAWSRGSSEKTKLHERIRDLNPWVVEDPQEGILGYADLQPSGYIDHFFVHAEHQGRGVGGLLMKRILETATQAQMKRLWADVSITAQPFFSRYRFETIRQQTVTTSGVELTNFRMERSLIESPFSSEDPPDPLATPSTDFFDERQ